MRKPCQTHRIGFLLAALALSILPGTAEERPNILWLSTEDIGPHLGCYGDPLAKTPQLDLLAENGIRFTNAFTVAGVCAPNRSAIITGVYQTTLGTHHMRSGGEGTERSIKPALPDSVKCFSEYLREAGYYCTNASKEDYNFPTPESAWDESSESAHWRNREDPEQPFFAVFNYTNTHEGSVRSKADAFDQKTSRLTLEQRQLIEENIPPSFHPDTPVVRENWAKYRELITGMDYWVGDHLQALEDAGLTENTIVFFWSDHGPGLPRCKRWLYDSGTQVPLIVYAPQKYQKMLDLIPGQTDSHLVSSIDLAPTVLSLCGLQIPQQMQGRPFLLNQTNEPRNYVFAARDRMDDRYDIIRMVRDQRFKYIRNYEPFKPYDQFMNSAEQSPVKQEFHRMAKLEELGDGQAWFLKTSKPPEELYDMNVDPHELKNIADDPAYFIALERMRQVHADWMIQTHDLGLIPEAELVLMENRFGSRYAIVPAVEKIYPGFLFELREIAMRAGTASEQDLPFIFDALKSSQPAIRYWGAIGLGVFGKPVKAVPAYLAGALHDRSPSVRIAAAESLLQMSSIEAEALDILRNELKSGEEWVRLRAALALDAIDEKARPAIPELEAALNDTENKYVVRVVNRALNQLQGTQRKVR